MVPSQAFKLQHEIFKMQNLTDFFHVFTALAFFLNLKVKTFIQKPLLHFHSVAKNPRKPLKWYKASFSITLQNTQHYRSTTGFNLCLSSNTYYSSTLIIHLLILLLMIRHRALLVFQNGPLLSSVVSWSEQH